jgi:hypothetical protein
MVLVALLTKRILANYWSNTTLANLYFLVKITQGMDDSGGRMVAQALEKTKPIAQIDTGGGGATRN